MFCFSTQDVSHRLAPNNRFFTAHEFIESLETFMTSHLQHVVSEDAFLRLSPQSLMDFLEQFHDPLQKFPEELFFRLALWARFFSVSLFLTPYTRDA